MSGSVHIGTSGWSYKHWTGLFYPAGLPSARWLTYYSQYFDTVEVNNTFYHLPSREVFEKWRNQTPPEFIFTLKAGRVFTHMQRLANPEKNLKPFLEHASGLGDKFQVLLVQLPAGFGAHLDRLEELFRYLSQQTMCHHLQTALEIRDPALYNSETLDLLRNYRAALVMADWPGFANEGPVTSELVYLRRHGPDTLYASDYNEEMLQKEAKGIRQRLTEDMDVFVYYNNDAGGFAVKDALRLQEILQVGKAKEQSRQILMQFKES